MCLVLTSAVTGGQCLRGTITVNGSKSSKFSMGKSLQYIFASCRCFYVPNMISDDYQIDSLWVQELFTVAVKVKCV